MAVPSPRPVSNPLTLTNLPQGLNTFQVYAVDGAGNQSATVNYVPPGATSPGWTVQSTPPVATIVPINGPQSSPVNTITIGFSVPVAGFTASALTLSENGGPNLLTGTESLTTPDGGKTWTLTGLANDNLTIPLNTTFANYTLTLTAKNSGIHDSAGNLLAANASMTFQRTEMDSIVGLNTTNGQWNLASNGLSTTMPAGFNWPAQYTYLDVQVGDFDGSGKDEVAGRAAIRN